MFAFQGKKKKPFINKKNAVSFHLVHRSQRDPLQADDESSKHVLMPAGAGHNEKVNLMDFFYLFIYFFDVLSISSMKIWAAVCY